MLHNLQKTVLRLETKFDTQAETNKNMKELLDKIYWARVTIHS